MENQKWNFFQLVTKIFQVKNLNVKPKTFSSNIFTRRPTVRPHLSQNVFNKINNTKKKKIKIEAFIQFFLIRKANPFY